MRAREVRMAIVQLLQVTICVRDLVRSARFYRDVLGCREIARATFDGAAPAAALGLAPTDFGTVLLERDGMRLELIAFAAAAVGTAESEQAEAAPVAIDRPGLSHLTVAVDDLRSTLHSLRDRGVQVREGSLVEQANGAATCLVDDPDGLAVLLYQRPVGAAMNELPIDPDAPPGHARKERSRPPR